MKTLKEFKMQYNINESSVVGHPTFSKPKGFVQISKDEHDAILKKRLDHEKEHGTKNYREALSKRDNLSRISSVMVANDGDQSIHGLPGLVAIHDAKKGATKYYRQPAHGQKW